MNHFLKYFQTVLSPLQALSLLILRIWVAQEFLFAGYTKLSAGTTAPEWFAGLQFPFPVHLLPINLNWVMAGTGEVVLGGLLLIGLFGRLASLGLLFITWVATYSVHFDLGWAGWNQIDTEQGIGFKVPLMIGIMLLQLLASGMGKWSLDAFMFKQRHQPKS